jgi:hypothetical protein
MRKFIARLNRAHKRAGLVHELRSMRTWGGPCADARAPRIVAEIAAIDAQDRADPQSWPRVAVPMPLLERAAPAYPRHAHAFGRVAAQVLAMVVAALALGSLWN